jgi:hypothetical protein
MVALWLLAVPTHVFVDESKVRGLLVAAVACAANDVKAQRSNAAGREACLSAVIEEAAATAEAATRRRPVSSRNVTMGPGVDTPETVSSVQLGGGQDRRRI